uniref:Reverse transcriptase domain-containing protein n=1 Tax=Tanacetum cinerariifolium TaxID=118510 RepID=A0A699LGX6_TANCI|nr:hypothetical protein [Tanacetum cinerariifolium]
MLQARENLMPCIQTFLKKFNRISFRETPKELAEYINSPSWNRPAFYDDDDNEYSIQVSEKSPIEIAPVLPTEEPDNSLNTSIVSSPKIDSLLEEFAGELAHIDPISPGIDETDYDPKDDIRFIEKLLYDDTSSDDDSFKDIDYVEASPLDSELFSLEEVKDKILHAKLLNIHLLINKIESLNNNPTPDCVLESPSLSFLSYSDNSLPEFETFSDHTKGTSSGSTTTHADNSLPEYDLFLFEIEPDQDSDFSSSDDSIGSGLEVSFPSETRNKIFDSGIFNEVQSERLLSREKFSISFICDPLYPVFDTLLSFLFENKDKVFKPGILSYLLVSHQDKTTSDFFEYPMMMYGGAIPLLDVSYLIFIPLDQAQVWGIDYC